MGRADKADEAKGRRATWRGGLASAILADIGKPNENGIANQAGTVARRANPLRPWDKILQVSAFEFAVIYHCCEA